MNVYSQKGEYFIQNYLPKEYTHGANNNGATQDKEGRIFIANQSGVLIYDGINWQLAPLPEEITVFSIISDEQGNIFVGADNGEFGTIEKNSNGRFDYVSLKQNLAAKDQSNEPIKQIVILNKAIYFLAADKLIEYKNGNFKAFSPLNSFHIRALVMGKHLFLTDLDNNVLVLESEVLKFVAGTENLISKKAFFSYKINANTFAVGYRGDGFYKVTYDSVNPVRTKFERWETPIDNELNEAETNNGYLLRDGNYIISSNKKGAFLINKNLEIIKRFNSKSGIYEDNVKSAFQDVNGNLWLSTYYGISYVELNTKLFKFDRQNGISGLVSSACYYKNSLYLSTDKGVQFIKEKENTFSLLPDFNKQTWSLLNLNNNLLISTDKGLYVYDGNKISQKSEKKTFCLLNDPHQKNILYAGTDEGVDVFSYNDKGIEYVKSYTLNNPVKTIAYDDNRNIYFGCESNGIYYLNGKNSFSLDSIQKKEGLPLEGGETSVFTWKNKLLIGTYQGIYAVKPDNGKRFVCVKSLDFYTLTQDNDIFRGAELEGDVICSQSIEIKLLNKLEKRITYFAEENGKYVVNNEATNRLKDTKPNQISYDSVTKTAFICTDEGLYLLSKQNKKIERHYNLFLRAVLAKKDTIVQNIFYKEDPSKHNFEIPYSNNQLIFSAGYNCFENKSAVEFCYYIEGSDDKTYTNWNAQNLITTTNLHEGNYVFHLKARCDLNKDVLEMSFPFKILPPWYRTIWAYVVYFILFVLFLVLVIKLNSKRLIEKNLKLEIVIKQRTSTIEEQVNLLEKQKHVLQHQKKEITDSINYAQRIQQSILPSLQEISSTHENTFVFFQPKDIVSGDFYWFNKINDHEFLIACADCTGHGVPGAFMSTICSDKLTEAAVKNSEPAKILFNANNAIKKVLKQDAEGETKNKDGMEIALVKYNSVSKKLIYAGANRALWIVKAGTRELIEEKPTKASVASFTPFNFEYEQHEVTLEENDMVYLASDGYPDQFGGTYGKKFMAKKMKQFLKDIMHLPLAEQNKLISKEINDWKGNLEQVDDLLVIGLKA